MEDTLNRARIRATFGVKGGRPLLLAVDKNTQNIDGLVDEITTKLNLDKRYKYQLMMDSGAVIDNISLIDQDDVIYVQVKPFVYPWYSNAYQISKPMIYPDYNNAGGIMPPFVQNFGMFKSVPNAYPGPYSEHKNYSESGPYGSNLRDPSLDIKGEAGYKQGSNEVPAAQLYCQNPEDIYDPNKFAKLNSVPFNDMRLKSEIADGTKSEEFSDCYLGTRNSCSRRSKSKDSYSDDYYTSSLSEVITSQRCDLQEIESRKFFDRDEMIELVRVVAKNNGFNICIPRGDIKLNDGTEQVTLYGDKYGNKRKRAQDGKERYSKKTNCKWKVKFQKKVGVEYYTMTPSSFNQHNHHMNFNIKKRKTNKLQGKRSHVKYREMQRIKLESKIKNDNEILLNGDDNKKFKRFKDELDRDIGCVLKQRYCEPSCKQNGEDNKSTSYKLCQKLNKSDDKFEDIFDSNDDIFKNMPESKIEYYSDDFYSSSDENTNMGISSKSSIKSSLPHFLT